MRRPRALVLAHRGASAERPENTRAAFELAVAQGADAIETDLHLSRDGAVVLLHDAELERLGGRGVVGEAALAELRALDAGGGEPVPELGEVLDAFGARVAFNLELKRGLEAEYPGLEARALAAVEARGLLGRTLFSAFYDPLLRTLRARSPEARIGLLLSPRYPARWLERARALGAEALHPEASLVDAPLVEAAHAEGLAVHPYTVDEEDALRRLLALGVDGVFTNRPARLRRLVDETGGAEPTGDAPAASGSRRSVSS